MKTAAAQRRHTAARTPPTMAPILTGFDVVGGLDGLGVVDVDVDVAVVAVDEPWERLVGEGGAENDVVEG